MAQKPQVTLLLKHKSKIINLASALIRSSTCRGNALSSPLPEEQRRDVTARASLGLENLPSRVSQGNAELKCSQRAVCHHRHHLRPWSPFQPFEFAPRKHPFKVPPEQFGMGPVASRTNFPLAIPTSPTQKCTSLSPGGKSTLPSMGAKTFLLLFIFLNKIRALHTRSQLGNSKSWVFSCNFGVLFSACSLQFPALTQTT